MAKPRVLTAAEFQQLSLSAKKRLIAQGFKYKVGEYSENKINNERVDASLAYFSNSCGSSYKSLYDHTLNISVTNQSTEAAIFDSKSEHQRVLVESGSREEQSLLHTSSLSVGMDRSKSTKPLEHGCTNSEAGPNGINIRNVQAFALDSKCDDFSHATDFNAFVIKGFDLRNESERALFVNGKNGFDWNQFEHAMFLKFWLFFETCDRNCQHLIIPPIGCDTLHPGEEEVTRLRIARALMQAAVSYNKRFGMSVHFDSIVVPTSDPEMQRVCEDELQKAQAMKYEDDFFKRLSSINSLSKGYFFHKETQALQRCHAELLRLTKAYCDERGASEDPKVREKDKIVKGLLDTLNSADEASGSIDSPANRYKQVYGVYFTITQKSFEDKTLAEHRHPRYARYIANVLSILLLVPAIARAAQSYAKYDTCRFWKTSSERLIYKLKIESNKVLKQVEPKEVKEYKMPGRGRSDSE